MSESIRQANIFAAEDYKKIFKSFQFIDYKAYDFDTLKTALVNYIRTYYPEDFNDYIESSEFIAIIELIAYLGTSLAFRNDLNSRENFMDTAERRESIIRLAKMVNYQPKRNIAATGLFKVTAIQTNQLLTDPNGINLGNTAIYWDDPNNPDWYDQFIQVLNAATNPTNPFGKPSKAGTIGGIPTELYQLNNTLRLNVTYPTTIYINGTQYPFDIVNPDFQDNLTFFERHPDPDEAFNLIYRNDSLGFASNNSGFFLNFKQGKLISTDARFDFPLPNRVYPLSATNVNQTDVYVQETDQSGTVIAKWKKVPALSGENIIYNSIKLSERNIFDVITETNDKISIRFADGNFGNVPTGLFRFWTRQSANTNLVIRPEDAQSLDIVIPYFGADGSQYNLRIFFALKQTISNSAPSETNEQIKVRAPEVFYTQERMVNNADYNILPLTFGNQVAKLAATNRVHSGQSRYIDTTDPTGFHRDLIIFGEDASLYRDKKDTNIYLEENDTNKDKIENIILEEISAALTLDTTKLFYLDEVIRQIEQVSPTEFVFDVNNPCQWVTSPDIYKNFTGFFAEHVDQTTDLNDAIVLNTPPYSYIKSGATLKVRRKNYTVDETIAVTKVQQAGEPFDPDISDVGPVELGSAIENGSDILKVYPPFRIEFNNAETKAIKEQIATGIDFGIAYDVLSDEWVVLTNPAFPNTNFTYADPTYGWYVRVTFPATGEASLIYTITTRGSVYVLDSYRSVRFYWDPRVTNINNTAAQAKRDTIEILPVINTDSSGNPMPPQQIFAISNVVTQNDGYTNPASVEIIPYDSNEDGIADNVEVFWNIVSDTDTVIFEKYIDTYGYETTRPWVTGWIKDLENEDGVIVDVSVTPPVLKAPSPSTVEVAITKGDLIFLKNNLALASIVSSLNTSLADPALVSKVNEFVNLYCKNKSFRVNNQQLYYTLETEVVNQSVAPSGLLVISQTDENHFEKNGRVFNQDTNTDESPIYFKWKHYSPLDQRIDPAPSNIIDMIVLTYSYYRDVLIWKDSSQTSKIPAPPTTEDLRIQFGELEKYKMVSDSIVFNSGKFKLLFGASAPAELQATFKVVKAPNANISDNEIKTKVIQAIDTYFDISNWDFGERFYYTELAAYIHQRLSRYISTVVIVPNKESSQFGNLFEIVSNSNELFLSTATVDNVQLVSNLTETNLRV